MKKKKGANMSPYEKAIETLSHEDRVIQKNLKILLNMSETIEQFEYAVVDKNNMIDIFSVIEHAIEKVKAQKKFS